MFVFAARDPFGVRPLYTTYHDTLVDDSVIEFASELKQLRGIYLKTSIFHLFHLDHIKNYILKIINGFLNVL